MKINFNQEIKTIEGESIAYGKLTITTLKDVTLQALLAVLQDEQNLGGEEKAKRWLLAMRIYSNQEDIDLMAEDVVIIKRLIGKAYGPLFVGQAWEMLEGKNTKEN